MAYTVYTSPRGKKEYIYVSMRSIPRSNKKSRSIAFKTIFGLIKDKYPDKRWLERLIHIDLKDKKITHLEAIHLTSLLQKM